jgi:hypothetical protein
MAQRKNDLSDFTGALLIFGLFGAGQRFTGSPGCDLCIPQTTASVINNKQKDNRERERVQFL